MKFVKKLALILVICSFGFLLAADWPQFRGDDVNHVLTNQDLPETWNDSTNIRWTQPMDGESWSSPIISGDKVFYSSAVLVEKAERPKKKEGEKNEDKSYLKDIYRLQLVCLNLKDGKELWKAVSFEGNPKIKKHDASTYACESPVTDGKHLYVYYGMHGVYCYDMQGKLVWEKDLGAFDTQRDWGTGSSPALYNGVLYLLVDNESASFLVALDAKTGKEKWRKNRAEKTTYATPVIWENNSRTELVTVGDSARAYNPANGDLLWKVKVGKNSSIPSPVFSKDVIYLGNTGGPRGVGNLIAIKAGANGDISPAEGETTSSGVVWSDSLAGIANPSPVLYDGLIYILASRGGEVSCFDAENGKLVYKEKVPKVAACWSTPWIQNNQLYFYDEKGITQRLQTGREFKVLGSHGIDDKFWASIAVAEDAYILKGVKNIYCVGK